MLFSLFTAGALMAAASSVPAIPEFDKLWNYDDPAATHEKFLAMKPEVAATGDREAIVQLETQIARTYSLRRKFPEAHETLDRVEKEARTLKIAEIRYLLERGRTFNSDKKQGQALPLFKEAFDKARDRGLEAYGIDAVHMLAIAEPTVEDQLKWNLKGLELVENSKDEKARRWRASLYNNIGFTYLDLGKFEQALDYFQRAVPERERMQDAQGLRVAKWAVARALRSLKRYDEALKIHFALEKEFAEINAPDGYVFEELGELFLATGKSVESKVNFQRAYALLSQDSWLMENEKARMERMKKLGE